MINKYETLKPIDIVKRIVISDLVPDFYIVILYCDGQGLDILDLRYWLFGHYGPFWYMRRKGMVGFD